MRVVFMGTPDFSVPALENIAKKYEVVAVVTQQDRPKGRGHKMQYTPVKEKAIELEIPVYQPKRVKDHEFVDILKTLKPDVIVVIAFGQILSKEILELPKYGCINVHASLLPKYRGAAPIQWAVINGDKKSGVTTMYMAEGLDTGDIIDTSEIVLDEKETGGSLFDKLADLGGKLILNTLDKLETGTATRTRQDDARSTYAGKITKELGKIDFTKSAAEIERLIRGLNPWPSAFTYMDDKMLKIWNADVLEETVEEDPGTITEVNKKFIKVATGEGYLLLKEIQLEGKKRMDVTSFLNGYNFTANKLGN
ncbi:methionyl-tRNA formyltransferase [uncultured Eubacterium sp.]|uniref:methionyl-tRNA formyltransferase n=1 Tax=uncultured Eubacterium sp. TaxID=165185 RepID=UPI00262CD1E9|nr:methionyl-tRNA formyltransferase [uncultured Eubacterium sp.]